MMADQIYGLLGDGSHTEFRSETTLDQFIDAVKRNGSTDINISFKKYAPANSTDDRYSTQIVLDSGGVEFELYGSIGVSGVSNISAKSRLLEENRPMCRLYVDTLKRGLEIAETIEINGLSLGQMQKIPFCRMVVDNIRNGEPYYHAIISHKKKSGSTKMQAMDGNAGGSYNAAAIHADINCLNDLVRMLDEIDKTGDIRFS